MITILTRIFPYDISAYIYQYYKSSIIEEIMIPKLYIFELTLDNLIIIYSNQNNTLITPNFIGFKLIANGLQNIKKYNYNIDSELQNKIDKLREIIKYLILIISNTNEQCFNRLLTNLL